MKKSSNKNIRDQVMGLGQSSMRKNYYRELMEKQKKLEEKNAALENEIERRKQAEKALQSFNEELENIVDERTKALEQSNVSLKASLNELEKTQRQLIEVEKLASLGTLVRGISHEINTPLGVGVTTATYLIESAEELLRKTSNNNLTKLSLEQDLIGIIEATRILLSSVEKSATLVDNFKRIASDQNHYELEEINAYDYIDMVLAGMMHSVDSDFRLETSIQCDEALVIKMYPGILSQIITIFVSNSLSHGFASRRQGRIDIELFIENDEIHFKYSDDGNGMDETVMNHAFDPFFTTTRTGSTSGLGLFIAYNLITNIKGSIEFTSVVGKGTQIFITVPREHKFIQK